MNEDSLTSVHYVATLLETFEFCKVSFLLKVVSTSSTANLIWNKACVYKRVCWEVGSVSIQIKSCIRQESCGQDLPHRLTSLALQFLYLLISCFISHQLFVLAVIRWVVKSNYCINLFSIDMFFIITKQLQTFGDGTLLKDTSLEINLLLSRSYFKQAHNILYRVMVVLNV